MTIMPSPSSRAPSGNVRKFQFDDFDVEPSPETVSAIEAEPTLTIAEANALRLAGEAEGRALGLAEANACLDADAVRLLGQIAEDIAAMAEERRRQQDFISAEAVRLALAIAGRVLPAYAEAGALREIEALITACFKERSEDARLVIRLPDILFDPIQARLDRLAKETGFAGTPVLLADAALSRTEARVEWANGGADWNFAKQLDEIAEAAHRAAGRGRHMKTEAALPEPIEDLKET
jgi:flagellar assembly protein FliH